MYIDNTTKGKIPFVRGKTSLKGLVPGMIESIGALNPMDIMMSFVEGSTPPCKKITRTTGPWDKNGRMKRETHYVGVKDMEGFANRLNATNQKVINFKSS